MGKSHANCICCSQRLSSHVVQSVDSSCIDYVAGAKHLSMTLTRSKFEQLTDGLLNRTRQPCKDCLKDAGISQSEVTEVLLVGGMTRMPKVTCCLGNCVQRCALSCVCAHFKCGRWCTTML